MFAINEAKCKTHLKLAIERMKVVQKRKAENAMKARKEIFLLIKANKIDRARIKVEHLIREDYIVEAIETVELFCDLLLARLNVFLHSRQIDVAVEEAVSNIIWAGPRLESEIPELKKVLTVLVSKLGKTFVDECTCNKLQTVNQKLINRMSIETPNKLLVEKYLVEIASSHGITYDPDPVIMNQDHSWNLGQQYLINFGNNNSDEKQISNDYISVPPPSFPTIYPSAPDLSQSSVNPNSHMEPAITKTDLSKQKSKDVSSDNYTAASDWYATNDSNSSLPLLDSSLDVNLPDVPNTEIANNRQSNLDFDDLSRRFQELKNRK